MYCSILASRRKLDIVWLDVPVDVAVLVDVIQAIQKALHDLGGFLLFKQRPIQVFYFIFLVAELVLPELERVVKLAKYILG